MTEGTLREPHSRTYVNADGQIAEFITDDHGVVQISEEFLDSLLTQTGFTENAVSFLAPRTSITIKKANQ